jgi:molybdenum cofactor biosynthesis enzyme MoaA
MRNRQGPLRPMLKPFCASLLKAALTQDGAKVSLCFVRRDPQNIVPSIANAKGVLVVDTGDKGVLRFWR